MSLQPRPWPEPAEEIATAVRVMYRGRRAPLPVVIRDELGELFADEQFVEAFADRGTPGWSPGRLALVTALQMVENLTDRQAAEAVRDKVSWKYALGLGLADTGFDFSVLCEFRTRVAERGMEAKALDLLVTALVDKGLVKTRGKARTDSTHVLAAVRDLNRLELAGQAVRAALEGLAAAAPQWLGESLDVPGWADRYGLRVDSWRLPTSKTKRAELAAAYGADGFTLLEAVYAPDSPPWLAQLPVVEALRRILVQNYVLVADRQGREVITMRDADTHGLPPGRCRITSPYDTDARYGGKRDLVWNGYKLHITETCDAEPVLLLSRLGLRAAEVAALSLDDVDWRTGEVLIHGKGGRLDRLPLPVDVGEAMVDYLRHGRPRSPYRRLFLIGRAAWTAMGVPCQKCVARSVSWQPALAIDGQVPPAAGDLLPAVVAASGRADGIGALDDLGVHDAGAGLGVSPLVLAQQLPQPADQRERQAAAVPPLIETHTLPPRREIDRQRPPLDPVADDVGDGIAHRPQVMDHRPAYRDGQFRRDLPGPRLQHLPLLIGQVRQVTRPAVTAPVARRGAAWLVGSGRVDRHPGPRRQEGFDTSPLPGVPGSSAAPRRT